MAKLIALYRPPADPAEFDRVFFEKQVPLVKKVPGLRRYEVTRGPIAKIDGTSQYYMIATLTFDSIAAIEAALDSDAGRAAAMNVAAYGTAGVELLIAETQTLL